MINENKLINAYDGVVKDSITKEEAIIISNNNILDEYKISGIEIIYEVEIIMNIEEDYYLHM